MKRKVLLVIVVAAVLAAVSVLTTGAFAGTSGRSDQPSDSGGGFVSCLASHGVQAPNNESAALKQWLADHRSDPAVQAALQACQPKDGTDAGPTPAALIACLGQHGVDVPSDVKASPDLLKPWLAEAVKQPSVRAALNACTAGPAPNGQTK